MRRDAPTSKPAEAMTGLPSFSPRGFDGQFWPLVLTNKMSLLAASTHSSHGEMAAQKLLTSRSSQYVTTRNLHQRFPCWNGPTKAEHIKRHTICHYLQPPPTLLMLRWPTQKLNTSKSTQYVITCNLHLCIDSGSMYIHIDMYTYTDIKSFVGA